MPKSPQFYAELRLRVAAGLLLAPPALLSVYLGSPAFDVMLIASAGILWWEWTRMCAAGERDSIVAAGFSILCAVMVAAALAGVAIALPLLLVGAAVVFSEARSRWTPAGLCYLGLPLLALIWLREEVACGRTNLIWLFAVVWASDMGAYAVGSLLGGPKLAPSISPNKTWSGAIGGLAAAVTAGVGIAAVGGGPLAQIAALGATVGLSAQAGDLFESAVKRRFGVKNASGLIPGHGGLLDRVDGLLPASLTLASAALLRNSNPWT